MHDSINQFQENICLHHCEQRIKIITLVPLSRRPHFYVIIQKLICNFCSYLTWIDGFPASWKHKMHMSTIFMGRKLEVLIRDQILKMKSVTFCLTGSTYKYLRNRNCWTLKMFVTNHVHFSLCDITFLWEIICHLPIYDKIEAFFFFPGSYLQEDEILGWVTVDLI